MGRRRYVLLATLLRFLALLVQGAARQEGILDDSADAEGSGRLLRRHRRFLFPAEGSGYKINVKFRVTFPIESVGSDMQIRLPFTYSSLTNTVSGRDGVHDFVHHEEERLGLISTIESYLGNLGSIGTQERSESEKNTHACMLRMLCEASMTPHHDHGMLGDLFNLLLTPAHLLKSVPEFLTTLDGDYLRAQMDGRLAKNCSRYSVDCSKSMFEFVDYYEPQHNFISYEGVNSDYHNLEFSHYYS